MSVISSRIMVEGATLKIDNKFGRTYVNQYLIETNNVQDTQYDVYLGMFSASPDPVPALWSTYGIANGTAVDDSYTFLQSIDLKRKEDRNDERYFWIATCTWSPPPEGEDPTDQPENPLDRPVKFSMEWANYTRVVERDKDGDAIVNYADDAFDPPLEVDDARPVLTAVKNMWPLEDIISLAVYYKNAVNTDSNFYGATARQAKVDNIVSGQLLTENGVDYYQVVIRVQFNEETWDKVIMERGSHARFFTSGTQTTKMRVRKNGDNLTAAQAVLETELLDFALLDSNGTQKGDGELPEYSSWRIYPEKSFTTGGPFGNGLGIGS